MTVSFTDIDSADTGSGPGPVVTTVIGGQTFMFVGNGNSSTISGFRVGANGSLTSLGPEVPGPVAISSMTVVTAANGGTYLHVAGFGSQTVATFAVSSMGALVSVGAPTGLGFQPNAIASVKVGESTFVFAGSDVNDTVKGYAMTVTGSLIAILGSGAPVNASALASAVVGGTSYLFTAGKDAGRVSAYTVAANGALTLADSVNDTPTLQLSGAAALTTAVLGGKTFLFAAGYIDDGISAFQVAANGSLTNVDNISDSKSAALELADVISLTTGTIGGKTFLFGAGQADSGVSVFAVSANGILTNVGNVGDDSSRELAGSSGVKTVVIGGVTYLLASGMSDNGVSVFRLDDNSANDTYLVDSATDTVDETGGSGTDLVIASISFSLSDPLRVFGDVENLTLTGTANLNGTGNNLVNTIIGNAGRNILDGKALKDTLRGLNGSDTYLVDSTKDTVIEASGRAAGTADHVKFTGLANQTYVLAPNVELLTLTGSASSRGTGNGLSNTMIGNSAANILSGGSGNDRLDGMAGRDRLKGGTGNDRLEGGTSNDLLDGGTGRDLLSGEAGNDTLDGGVGRDRLTGGAGRDFFALTSRLSPANADSIADFRVRYDTIELENRIFRELGASVARAELEINTTGRADDRDDFLIYERDTGELYYDRNGNRAGGSVLVAVLDKNLRLTASDFDMI